MGGVSGTGIFVLSLEYVVIIASSFIAAIGVTGNLCVLFICSRLRREAGMYGIYYASLAFADLLLMGPCLIPQIWAHCQGHKIEISEFWVQVWGFTYITARMSSILNLSLISLERMVAVLAPHFYRTRLGKKYAAVVVSVCWFLSLSVAVSPFLLQEGYQYYSGAAMSSTNLNLANNHAYWITTEVLALYLPTLIIIVSISVISWRVRRMRRRDHRITRTLMTVLIAYLACFTVYFVWILLRFLQVMNDFATSVQLYLQNFAFLILGIHSAINPIIYAFKAAQFKVELRQINDKALVKFISLLIKIRSHSQPASVAGAQTLNTPLQSKRFNNVVEMEMGSVNDKPRVEC